MIENRGHTVAVECLTTCLSHVLGGGGWSVRGATTHDIRHAALMKSFLAGTTGFCGLSLTTNEIVSLWLRHILWLSFSLKLIRIGVRTSTKNRI